jgi:hypothetical protein
MTTFRLQENKPMDCNAIAQWIIQTPSLFHRAGPIEAKAPFSQSIIPDSFGQPVNPRLGFLYQHICAKLFSCSPVYTKKAEEIQLIQAGKTIGAIDFIVKNHQTLTLEHWEVAVKFYLLYHGRWYGPSAQDRLDRKLTHMLSHQLPLSKHTLFVQRYPHWQGLSHHLLMQGRLYINPFIPEEIPTHCQGYALNTSQIQGYWCHTSQVDQIREPLYTLVKPQWLIGQHNKTPAIAQDLQSRAIHCQSKSGKFWFIVPESWPDNHTAELSVR